MVVLRLGRKGEHKVSLTESLMLREVAICKNNTSSRYRHLQRASFAGIRPQASFDAPAVHCRRKFSPCSALLGDTKIKQVASFGHMVFALTASGICTAFSTVTGLVTCQANRRPDEAILMISVNSFREELLVTAGYLEDDFTSILTRAMPIADLERGEVRENSIYLFEREELAPPGFVQYSGATEQILTYDSHSHLYKIWCMHTYKMLHAIQELSPAGGRVADVLMNCGMMTLLVDRGEGDTKVVAYDANETAVTSLLLNAPCYNIHVAGAHIFAKDYDRLVLYDPVAQTTYVQPHPKGAAVPFFIPHMQKFAYVNGSRLIFLSGKQARQQAIQLQHREVASPSFKCHGISEEGGIVLVLLAHEGGAAILYLYCLSTGFLLSSTDLQLKLPKKCDCRNAYACMCLSATYNADRRETYVADASGKVIVLRN